MRTDGIPLMVGVTGHRAVRPEDEPALMAGVERELQKLQERYPHSPLIMLNSLAQGADQLCARVARRMDIPLVAVLPMDRTEYARDFSDEALDGFLSLLGYARRSFTAPAVEAVPDEPPRSFFYRQAGIYVATHCHVLLALWDGRPGDEAGCGTAETVDFALSRSYRAQTDAPLSSHAAVLHLFTPQGEDPGPAPGTTRSLGDDQAWQELMDRTEEFNAFSDREDDPPRPLLPPDREADPLLHGMERVYQRADRLSLRFAGTYRRILILLAVVSTLITACFLLYDEANMHWLILVCGLSLIFAWCLQRYSARSRCHRRYLEYRVLAESLRVQAFLRYGGAHREAVTLLPWSQQHETAWIAMAMTVLGAGAPPDRGHDIRTCWVQDQLIYHSSAQTKARSKLLGSGRVVGAALLISVGLYLAALVFELRFGGILPRHPAISNAETYRTWLKLALGSISAATLFISNYYGKLSLSRGVGDHEKMAAFYGRMEERLTRFGQDEPLLVLLAREELIENGNWCSYQRDNAPDFSL